MGIFLCAQQTHRCHGLHAACAMIKGQTTEPVANDVVERASRSVKFSRSARTASAAVCTLIYLSVVDHLLLPAELRDCKPFSTTSAAPIRAEQALMIIYFILAVYNIKKKKKFPTSSTRFC